MTFDAFNTFIDIAKNAGITHIILFSIVCSLKNNVNKDNLTFIGTVNNWQNYTNIQKTSLINKMNNYGIILMASFGGVLSFKDGFEQIYNSPNYKDYKNLANDLIEWMILNKIFGIDFNIESLPGKLDDAEQSKMINYLGSVSQKIKEIGQDMGFYIYISHSPLAEYFNGPEKDYDDGYWKHIYNKIEQKYEKYIDFYIIRYYNNTYITFDDIFLKDSYGKMSPHASVLQLINANQINPDYFKIPDFKIVVCKPSNPNATEPTNGYIELYSTNNIKTNTLGYFIYKCQLIGTDPKLDKWSLVGGISIWKYSNLDNGDLDTANKYNSQIINLFTKFKK